MRRVLITGAAGGLGSGLISAFLVGGWEVGAGVHRELLKRDEMKVRQVFLDVTDAVACEEALQGLLRDWGTPDCLVNNAGITIDRSIGRLKESDWDRVLAVDLEGAMRCSRLVAPAMAARGGGQIISIGSYAARIGTVGQAAYASAKAGLIGLTQSLAAELGPRNVRANVVLPGVLQTGMTAGLSEERLEGLARANALGRLNSIEEVSRFVVFLAGMQDVSGQIFQLDSRIGRWV